METQTEVNSLPRYATRVRHDAEALADSVQEAAGQIENAVAVQMRERPWTTIALAAGAGFVIGGGLATRLTRLMIGVGGRMLVAMMIQELGARAGLTPNGPIQHNRNP